jgi:alkyl sulfatase BDS1-like metallo-beta-lactamase superfamily hydrolase
MNGANGNVIWSQRDYDFVEMPRPDTVNPSLWRLAQLNHRHGLFKVVDRVYQVRGFDVSNMRLIEGDTGVIVIDPLISAETAATALTFTSNIDHASRLLRSSILIRTPIIGAVLKV